jgi:uncharacterized membrane protein (UPF0127 family)
MLRCAVALLLPLSCALAFACGSGGSSTERVDVRIGSLTIRAEVARTVEGRALGLGGRASLTDDAGMLFLEGEEGQPSFWMQGMEFALDCIWISSDRRVVDLTEQVPPPSETGGEPVSDIRPAESALYVLEVNAGVVERAGVHRGDAVTFDPDLE